MWVPMLRTLASIVVLSACAAAAEMLPATTRVLFVGNSLTTVNDVPALVGQLAAASAQRYEYRTVAFNNYSLEDHWNRGDAQRAIAEGGWSIVVLQQGPSALPESRASLVDYAKRFATDAHRVRARVALFMVWPSSNRMGDFDSVRLSYTAATHAASGLLVPAGDAWREAWRRDSRLALYGTDGFHPTAAGSYLAAAVMYQTFFDRSPVGLPPLIVAPSQVRVLQESAAAVTSARHSR
jgi:hypothetical protein